MTTIVFPGQGAQKKGMCADLFKEYNQICQIADNVLGYSIQQLCVNDPDNCLNKTQFTQPALFTANALCYFEHQKNHAEPHVLAGHSLGEYNALLAAGAFDFATGLKLVQKRGLLMSQAVNGAMLAVIRSNESQIKAVLKQYQLDGIDIANYNTPSQIVLSGTANDIKAAKKIFDEEKIFAIPLKVSGAFHSRYMLEAAEEYRLFLNKFDFNNLKIPVIANVTGLPYEDGYIKDMLVQQLSGSVQWTKTIRYLMAINEVQDIFESGPGNVLTKLNADIVKNALPLSPDEMPEKKSVDVAPILSINKQLGSSSFINDYGLRYAYVVGSMGHGISGVELVTKAVKSGLLAFLGSYGLNISKINEMVSLCQKQLDNHKHGFGINIDLNSGDQNHHNDLINLCVQKNIQCLEVSNFHQASLALVKYKAKGLTFSKGVIQANNKLLIKTSKIKTAQLFMQPAPLHLLDQLLAQGEITEQQHQFCQQIPLASDICIQGDGAWLTESGNGLVKLPEVLRCRNLLNQAQKLDHKVRIGYSGGLATPESIAVIFLLGAEFVLTGSINQCTVEADVSDHAKTLLAEMTSEDTSCVVAGDVFESGAKAQVLSKGTFFPARAQKLYDLYRLYSDVNQLDKNTKSQLEKHFFNKTFDSILADVKSQMSQKELAEIEKNNKYKMLKLFQWYFNRARYLAIEGQQRQQNNYQIYCGPAMGAFNQWAKGQSFENWKNRHIAEIAAELMIGAERYLDAHQRNDKV